MRTESSAAVANVAIASLGAIATYYIATRPQLRRIAWNALKYAVITGVPEYLWDEVRRAWEETDPRRRGPAIMPM